MTEENLPNPPTISLIERISPSNFSNFRQCKLKAVLTAMRVPPLLPIGAASHLGSIAHKTLKTSGRHNGQFSDYFEYAWQRSLVEEESKMSHSWLERHLLPLKTQKGYDLKKGQCRSLFEAVMPIDFRADAAVLHEGYRHHEVWLSTKDGRVGGYVDAILKVRGGEAIIDYKSGKILDEGFDGSNSVLNEHDILQIKLYAALYYCNNGVWPQSIQLASFDGSFAVVPFKREECLQLLAECYRLLEEVNKTIEKRSPNNSAVITALSTPSPRSCLRCLYRPYCNHYWEAKANRAAKEWPYDFYGKPLEIKKLGNGTLKVKLQQQSDRSQPVTIRGLTSDRHPALHTQYKWLLFFSVLPDQVPNTYHEGALTTVYSVLEV